MRRLHSFMVRCRLRWFSRAGVVRPSDQNGGPAKNGENGAKRRAFLPAQSALECRDRRDHRGALISEQTRKPASRHLISVLALVAVAAAGAVGWILLRQSGGPTQA